MKNLEEEILKTTYSLEQLKKQRDKDFPKADQNEVNNEIDTTCNKIFYNHFDTIKFLFSPNL